MMGAMISPASIAARGAKDALKGAAFAAIASALCYAVAVWGFGKAYYLGVLIPLALVLFLLVAWLSHLRRGGFMKDYRQGDGLDGSASTREAPKTAPSASTSAAQFAALFAPRDDRIIPRASTLADAQVRRERRHEGKDGANGAAIRVLLWGSLWLGILAACLYRFAGVGASYYPR
jgi:hypothetical protein